MRIDFSRGTAKLLEMCGTSLFGKISKVRMVESGDIYACMELDCSIVSAEERAKLQREIDILPGLAHKHVVRYFESVHDSEAKMSYLLMEYFVVGELTDVIRQHRKERTYIAEDRIWSIFAQLLFATDYCHSIRKPNAIHIGSIVHRNIMPSNIFIGDGDTVKLGYFSLHQILSRNSVIRDAAAPFYTAPEVMQNLPYTEKADIWSLGCVLYELCALHRPFIESGQESLLDVILRNNREPIPDVYSQELIDIINLMLNINPDERPPAMSLLRRPKFGSIGVHKTMLDAQSEDIEILISQLKEKHKTLEDATNTVNNLNEQVTNLYMEAETLKEVLACKKREIDDAREEIEQRKKLQDELQEQYNEEARAGEEARQKIQEQSQQIEALATTLDDLNELLISHESTISTARKDLEDRDCNISSLERKVAALTTSKGEQHAKIQQLEASAETMKEEIGSLKLALEETYKQVNDTEGRNAALFLQLKDAARRADYVTELESQVAAQKEHVTDLEKKVALQGHDLQSALARIAALTLELDWGRHTLEERTSECATAQKELEAMHALYARSASVEATLGEKMREAKVLLKDYASQIEYYENIVPQLRERAQSAEDRLRAMEQELAARNSELKKITETANALEKKLADAVLDADQLRDANLIIMQERVDQEAVLEQKELELEMAIEKIGKESREKEKMYVRKPVNRYEKYARLRKLTIKESHMDTPLMQAIVRNEPFDSLTGYTGARDQYGRTALMRAAYYNNIPAVRFLIAAEGKMQDAEGNTALMFAVERENVKCAKILIREEAKYHTRDGITALMRAAHNGNEKLADLLCEAEGGMVTHEGLSALMLSSMMEHPSVVSVLRRREAGLVMVDGTPALLMAASTGNMDVIKMLFYSEGKIRDAVGRTALMVAAEMGRLEATRFMASTQSGLTTNEGETALMMAALYGHAAVVQVLYYREAGVQRSDGYTAMMHAASYGHCPVIDILRRREGNLRTSSGQTALIHAVKNNQFEAAGLLLSIEGALRDNSGKSALDYARAADNKDMIAYLESTLK